MLRGLFVALSDKKCFEGGAMSGSDRTHGTGGSGAPSLFKASPF